MKNYAIRHDSMRCDTIQYGTILFILIQYKTENTARCDAIGCNTIRHDNVLYDRNITKRYDAMRYDIKVIQSTYAGLLSGLLTVATPYKNTNKPTNDGMISQAVY